MSGFSSDRSETSSRLTCATNEYTWSILQLLELRKHEFYTLQPHCYKNRPGIERIQVHFFSSDFRKRPSREDLPQGTLWGIGRRGGGGESLHRYINNSYPPPAARWTRIANHVPDLLAEGAGERLWEHTKRWLISDVEIELHVATR